MSIGLTFQQYFMRVPLFDRRSRRAAPKTITTELLPISIAYLLVKMQHQNSKLRKTVVALRSCERNTTGDS